MKESINNPVSVREFRQNLAKYLKLAFSEDVCVKTKSGVIQLIPIGRVHDIGLQDEGGVHKKQIADKIVEEAMNPKTPEFGGIKNDMPPDTVIIPKNLEDKAKEVIGLCDVCGFPAQELWEHEEEGVERNVCRNCFQKNAFTLGITREEDFESFLGTKKGVYIYREISSPEPVVLHKTAEFSAAARPTPKPVKKNK